MKHDYTLCENTNCPQTLTCLRCPVNVLQRPGEHYWYSKFAPDPKTGVCEYYWPLGTFKLNLQNENQEKDSK